MMKYCVLLLLISAPIAAQPVQLAEQLGLRESTIEMRDRENWSSRGPFVVRVDSPTRLMELREVSGDAKLIGVRSAEEALQFMDNAHGLIGFCNAELLAAALKLRWIQLYSAGVEHCVAIPAVKHRNLLVTNMQRVSGPQISEHVMAMILALSRGLPAFQAAQAEGRWAPPALGQSTSWELTGKTLLLVGLGGIGTEVARRADVFGLRINAVRASGRPGPEFVDRVAGPEKLLELAGEADIVVNSTPLTSSTRDLFDAEFFSRMRDSAYFINVGRGKSVNTDALVDALSSGKIAGAGLDVTDPEPLPANHPLWTLPNVIITPHVAAGSDQMLERLFSVVKENLRRYVAGDALLSEVDLDKGY